MANHKSQKMLTQIKTKAQSDLLCSEIDTLLSDIYNVGGFKISIPEILKNEIEEKEINIKNIDSFKSYLEETQEKLSKMETVDLTIAFSPSETFVSKLSSWVKNDIDKNAILNIKTDTSIIGGAVVSFNGKYEDLSLKKSLGEYFNKKH